MITITQFVPSPVATFQFSPTLDNESCTVIVTWNVMGQRWYINLYGQDGALIVALPLIGSPDGLILTGIEWANGIVTVTTQVPHMFSVGSLVDMTLVGNAPDFYNDDFVMLVTGPNTLTFSSTANPGVTTQLGLIVHNINLVAGYFDSTLVYRTSSHSFEVTP